MRDIDVNTIIESVRNMCMNANYYLNEDIKQAMQRGLQSEQSPIGTEILNKLITKCRTCSKKESSNMSGYWNGSSFCDYRTRSAYIWRRSYQML